MKLLAEEIEGLDFGNIELDFDLENTPRVREDDYNPEPLSVCHVPEATLDEVRDYVYELMKPLELPKEVKWIINPSGTWTIGGPVADCGLTGRKIVCDQYGGYCAVGGGAFSGKDPSKVDRSGAYMARYIACDPDRF